MDKDQKNLFGLTEKEVLDRRQKFGDNLLSPPKRISPWILYFEKFKDPVIRILIFAALLSLVISIIEDQYAETIGIIAAILLATGIGFIFEYNAKRKFDLLNTINDDTLVKVTRGGQVCEVPRKDIVVDDIVILGTGDEVPADGTLLKAVSVQVNESSLTGEPVVNKTIYEDRFDKEATYASNRMMRGTTVVEGYATMIVTEVGDNTEIGHVARQSTEESGVQTPLNIQLERFAKLISKIGFAVAGLAFVIFVTRDLFVFFSEHQVSGWKDYMEIARICLNYFMMAVTLIVVAVPEGLPMSVTLSLALNMRRMLKTNNLVRSMHACETMGAINVICTDKTGTLTQNSMQVQYSHFNGMDNIQLTDDEVSRLIEEGIAVNTTAYLETADAAEVHGLGNPTEIALLIWLHRQGVDYLGLREAANAVSEITFSTERKYMATLVDSSLLEGKRILYIKGAPEIVATHCDKVLRNSAAEDIETYKPQMKEWLLEAQGKAMRTLGFAYKIVDAEASDCHALIAEGGLTFAGMVAIADPIREDISQAIDECRSAGINIKIVTGDTPGTATEIARQIGLWNNEQDTDINRITGPEFAALTDEEALDRVEKLKIISRARPSDKQRLVQLLQQRGAVVAVTGDGTNDAPALNHAQVGLSMGSGTSVAKEASDITLLDDSFASISTAVMWGRSLYKNIQRFIVFQLTINLVALGIELLGSFVGTQLPLTVTQMLWVNLIMDTFASLALSSIPPSKAVMKEKPRKLSDFIISRPMYLNIFTVGTIFLVLLMGLIIYFTSNDINITNYHLTEFFTIFVMLQFWNLFNVRVFGTSSSAWKGLLSSQSFMAVCGIILIGQIIIVQFGGAVFRTVPLDLPTWLVIIGATSFILWIGELTRFSQRRKEKKTWMEKTSKI
jgi:Ca2+-transporting ATPase